MAQPIAPEHILQTAFAFWPSKILLSAVELEIFTVLARGPLNLEQIKSKFGLHPRSAADFLDCLVALGFLQRDQGLYSNTPSTELFLDKGKPSYIGGIIEMSNARLYRFWTTLTEALKTGEKQNEAKHGEADFFKTLYEDPKRLEGFLRAMSGLSRGANLAIAKNFDWSKYKTFADVGTAQGDLAAQVALANPHLTGVGFDLPATREVFENYIASLGLAPRVKFQPGSFFEVEFPRADVIMMGHILHDWGLADKKMLLEKSHRALPPGGAVIVYDSIIDDDRKQNAFGLMMSVNMLIETSEGFDYTGADCQQWMKEAGFKETRVQHLVGPDSMVVGIK